MKTISFIIPVFNEEKRIQKTFEALSELQLPHGLLLQDVIFVDDGSTDKTKELVTKFIGCHPEFSSGSPARRQAKSNNRKMLKRVQHDMGTKIQIVSYPKNRGKGYAIRQGMLVSKSDYTLFFDADMSTPLSELSKFVPFIEQKIDIIVATRKNGHSTVIKHQPFIREYLGRVFTKIARVFLQLPVTDFTCGFKAFSKQAKEDIFNQTFVNRWGYDAEIMFLAKRHGFSWVEKSVLWSHDSGSKVHLLVAGPQVLRDLVRIRWEYSVKPFLSVIPNLFRNLPVAKTDQTLPVGDAETNSA